MKDSDLLVTLTVGDLKELLNSAKEVEEPLISGVEVQKEVFISEKTLYNYRQLGLPTHKKGRYYMYKLSEVKEFLTRIR